MCEKTGIEHRRKTGIVGKSRGNDGWDLCPKCGGDPEVHCFSDAKCDERYMVICQECGYEDDPDSWSVRYIEDGLRKNIETLTAKLREMDGLVKRSVSMINTVGRSGCTRVIEVTRERIMRDVSHKPEQGGGINCTDKSCPECYPIDMVTESLLDEEDE